MTKNVTGQIIFITDIIIDGSWLTRILLNVWDYCSLLHIHGRNNYEKEPA